MNFEFFVVENVGVMKVVRNYKKFEERKTVVVDSIKFVVFLIIGEMILFD